MIVKNGSDLTLTLELKDIDGNVMRVDDTATLYIHVFTDGSHTLHYTKDDVIITDEADKLAVDKNNLVLLDSGVVCYTYDYSVFDTDYNEYDGTYDNVETVMTDVYFANNGQTTVIAPIEEVPGLEEIYKQLEQEIKDRGQITNSLNNRLIDISEKLIKEIERSDRTEDAIYNEIDRANLVETTLDLRMAGIDEKLDILTGDKTVIGSVEHAIAHNEHYTDDRCDELKRMFNSIAFGDEGISLDNYYTKTEVDKLIDDIDVTDPYDDTDIIDRISTLESIDHSLYLTEHQSLDNYYTKPEIDEKLTTEYKYTFNADDNVFEAVGGVYNTKFPNMGIHDAREFDKSVRISLQTTECSKVIVNISGSVREEIMWVIQYKIDEAGKREIISVHPANVLVDVNPEAEYLHIVFSKQHPDETCTLFAYGEVNQVVSYLYDRDRQFYTKTEIDEKITDIPVYDDTDIKDRISTLESIDHSQYLTEHQSLSNYYTKEDTNDILTGFATKSYVNTVVEECARLDTVLGDKADKTSVYTKTEIDTKISDAVDAIEEYDDTDVKSRISTLEAIDHSQYLTEHQSLGNYYTKGQTDAAVTLKVDNLRVQIQERIVKLEEIDHTKFLTKHQSLDNYYTKTQTDTKIAEAVAAVDLSDYETIAGAAEKYQPKGDYLTEHQSLSGYAKTNTTTLTYYYTKSQSDDRYAKKSDIVPAYDDTALAGRVATLEAIDHSQYLTSHQSLSNYYTKSQTDTKISDAVAGVTVDLSDYYTKTQVDSKLGDIQTILTNIIG